LKLKTRVLLYLILFVLACAPLAAGQTQPESAQVAVWSRYTYPGEEFSVELPGVPAVFNTVRATNARRFGEEKGRVFSLYHDDVVYFVAAYDAPRSSESFDFFATQLRGAWGLAPKGALTLGGFEGFSYAVVGSRRGRLTYDLHGEGRVFRTGRHAYFALAVSVEEGRPEVGRFLDSFTLGASPAGQSVAGEEPVPRFVPPKTTTPPPPGFTLGPGHSGGGYAEPLGAGDRRVIIVYKPEPGYTEEARKKGVSGTVILSVVLAPDGSVTNIEPTKWLSNGLTERAIRAARQMLFFPARKDGRPVAQHMTLEYNFNVY
jgi:TonB family protein